MRLPIRPGVELSPGIRRHSAVATTGFLTTQKEHRSEQPAQCYDCYENPLDLIPSRCVCILTTKKVSIKLRNAFIWNFFARDFDRNDHPSVRRTQHFYNQ